MLKCSPYGAGCSGTLARGAHQGMFPHKHDGQDMVGWLKPVLLNMPVACRAPGGSAYLHLHRPFGAVSFGSILFGGAASHGHAWAPYRPIALPCWRPDDVCLQHAPGSICRGLRLLAVSCFSLFLTSLSFCGHCFCARQT
jgi:hypothetical protein